MGPLRTSWDWCSLGEPFSPSQVDPRELGAGGDLAERLQDTNGPGHSKYTETMPAQVGVLGGIQTQSQYLKLWWREDAGECVSLHPRK